MLKIHSIDPFHIYLARDLYSLYKTKSLYNNFLSSHIDIWENLFPERCYEKFWNTPLHAMNNRDLKLVALFSLKRLGLNNIFNTKGQPHFKVKIYYDLIAILDAFYEFNISEKGDSPDSDLAEELTCFSSAEIFIRISDLRNVNYVLDSIRLAKPVGTFWGLTFPGPYDNWGKSDRIESKNYTDYEPGYFQLSDGYPDKNFRPFVEDSIYPFFSLNYSGYMIRDLISVNSSETGWCRNKFRSKLPLDISSILSKKSMTLVEWLHTSITDASLDDMRAIDSYSRTQYKSLKEHIEINLNSYSRWKVGLSDGPLELIKNIQ